VTISVKPIKYLVCGLPEDDVDSQVWSITVEWRGPGDRWAVVRHAYNLSRSGKWHYESLPSNRTDRFLKDHRFSYDEAMSRALKAYPKVVINGLRVEDGRLVPA
jgi:hypothetical protein